MRIARFDTGDGARLGLVVDGGIVSLTRGTAAVPDDMVQLIAGWARYRHALEQLSHERPDLELSTTRLLAPISRPGKVMGIGLNYADHQAESGMEKPTDQLWFMMPATAIAGPHDPIPMPRVSKQLDYEVEMVVVISRRCRYLDREEAASAIFGYAVGNDVSVRDWQMRTSQVTLGKSFDGHAPFGPWITTADAVDAGSLAIECRVNGELRQSSNTRHMIFDPPAQVAHLSQVMTLEPGDVLFTGTPAGVAFGQTPPLWLKIGDRVQMRIEGLGEIENVVIAS